MKKIIVSIQNFLKKFYESSMKVLEKNAGIAVEITERIQFFVKSPVAGIIVEFIPGTFDNVARLAIIRVLDQVVPQFAFAYGIIKESENIEGDYNVVLNKVILHLRELHPQLQRQFWVDFSAEFMLRLTDDGKIDITDTYMLTQKAFKQMKLSLAA